jgi:chemotaxis family two-component system response regulator Rcp1
MPIEVLFVEDNIGDVGLTEEAFRDVNASVRLHVVRDGVDAMAFLRRKGRHVGAPRPDIILLDLNLPMMDGREFLALIKRDNSLKMIPAVILTASDADDDISKCYQLQASCFLRKPVQLQAFNEIVESINAFWLTNVKLPKRTSTGTRLQVGL